MRTLVTMMTQLSATTVMYLMILLSTLVIHRAAGYCAGLGANPGFKGPPIVEQVRDVELAR